MKELQERMKRVWLWWLQLQETKRTLRNEEAKQRGEDHEREKKILEDEQEENQSTELLRMIGKTWEKRRGWMKNEFYRELKRAREMIELARHLKTELRTENDQIDLEGLNVD